MKISQEEKKRLEDLYQSFLHDEKILKMKNVPMHRGSNTYEHSFKVAKKAIRHAIRYYKNVNLETILLGSILHDYYLYDWRSDRSLLKKHGKNHPFIASKNAKKDFDISSEVESIINAHMWPLNIKNFPHSKEARIVSICDKAVTSIEAMSSKKHKENKRDKYLLKIDKLFD